MTKVDQQAVELKPCPFCDGRAADFGDLIECGKCGAEVYGGKKTAAEKWNTRAALEAQDEVTSAMLDAGKSAYFMHRFEDWDDDTENIDNLVREIIKAALAMRRAQEKSL